MATLLKNLRIHEISLVDEPDNDEARVVIVKSRSRPDEDEDDDPPDIEDEEDPEMDANDMAAIQAALNDAEQSIETLAKAKGAAEAESVALRAQVAELTTEIAKMRGEAEGEDAILKSLPEPIRKRLLDAEAELAKARAKSEEDEAIAKARAFAPGDEEARSVGLLLLRIRKGRTTEDDAKQVEQIIKAGRAASRGGLFSVVGASAAVDMPDDPEAALNAKAEEIRKAKPSLTHAQAYAEALEQNPGLYNEYVRKRRAPSA